jgi:hypothetical protein
MESTQFKIKEKYKSHLAKYAKTSLDLNGTYTKDKWNKAGFKDSLLENVNNIVNNF